MRFLIELALVGLLIASAFENLRLRNALIETSDQLEATAYELWQKQCDDPDFGDLFCVKH